MKGMQGIQWTMDNSCSYPEGHITLCHGCRCWRSKVMDRAPQTIKKVWDKRRKFDLCGLKGPVRRTWVLLRVDLI